MGHLPPLIHDLALILITAGVVTILFKWLKQPVVLGYIVAGFIAGPNFVFFPSITDSAIISIWAEIGVIFLLFALGLEFSFKKLISVGGTASIASVFALGSMIAIGYIAGQLLGWSDMDSIFLGCMISMSSTTIIIKTLTDTGQQKQKFANIVFAMLIVEDLAAIVMMVLLSTFSVSQRFEGMELVRNIIVLVFFLLIWFVVGIYLIPTLLKRFQQYLNNETLLVVVIGLCLGMVLFASSAGFSSALGAFVMGSILAETVEMKRIEHLVEPLKNLFGAVFFVSVGMMIEPGIIVEHIIPILIISVIVVLGRIFFATLGVSVSGQSLKVSVQSGFCLAQIGEFSFIIATLGVTLGVIDDFLYPIIVAVSTITTFGTPYFIKVSTPVYSMLEKRIPPKWNRLLKGYSSEGYETTVNRQSDWNSLLRNVSRIVVIYLLICLSIIFVFGRFFRPWILGEIPSLWGRLLVAATTILALAPFMRAMIVRKSKSHEFRRLWSDNRLNRTGLMMLIAARVLICLVLLLAVLVPLFPNATAALSIVSMLIVALIIWSQVVKKQSRRIERVFLENLNRKERMEEQMTTVKKKTVKDLLDKDIHVEEVVVSQTSPSVGKTLGELNFKQEVGVNVVSVIRGPMKINIPDGNVILYPFDKLVVVGSDDEIQKCLNRVAKYRKQESTDDEAIHHIVLSNYIVEASSPLAGKTIRELNMRERTECMIIGIDRNGHSITNFTADFRLEKDDVLWLAGEKDDVDIFGDKYAVDEMATDNSSTQLPP
ncbi:MAG: cation:proton antiporter [Tannerella sp.]|jgi:CPA2 family monovalent cation:H+ antiporter-2|nr:cation:proton antiporter [Tannerella sp.]